MFRRIPRIRASPRHGGAVRCLHIYVQILIRRGGAPSGAAGFIANNYCIACSVHQDLRITNMKMPPLTFLVCNQLYKKFKPAVEKRT
jgi:hypothetical protein